MKFNVYTPWQWLVYVPLLVLSTAVASLLVVAGVVLRIMPPRQLNTFVPVAWARFNMAAIPAAVKLHGLKHIEDGQSYVVVANHLSHIDIFALYGSLPLDIRWVMKKELRKVPLIGVSCAALGHVFIDREQRHEAVRALTEARGRLAADGASVIFFPEGTRSLDGRLHAFKKGAFVMAKDMRLPILPVTLRGTDHVLPAKTLGLMPGRTEIIIHRPISAEQVAGRTADELMAEARAIIAGALPADRVAPLPERAPRDA